MRRNYAIDMLRGIVMMLMVLDHTRDYMSASISDATDLTQTTTALFLTRWVTHFCAPIFVFLAGTSAYLSSARRQGFREMQEFLAVRGIWLIILELTWIQFAWVFNWDYARTHLGVVWAIGVAMLALAAVVRFPTAVIGVLGLLIVTFHNLLDGISSVSFGSWAPLWKMFHEASDFFLATNIKIVTSYPVLPWIGVLFLGYCLGALLEHWGESRGRRLIQIGVGMCLGFIGIRFLNGYGDPTPWAFQSDSTMTLLSFINVTKYPPSLDYVLVTLGPGMIALGIFTQMKSLPKPIVAFGQVPLFFYLVHIPLIHLSAHAVMRVGLGLSVWDIGSKRPSGIGLGLVGTYLATVCMIACLYPISVWFGNLKMRKAHPLLRFL